MQLDFSGRSALITGGSRGIGYAVAEGLARAGCALHLNGRSADSLAMAKDKIAGISDVSVSVYPLDISVTQNVTALAEACPDVDILVNNAGATPSGPIEEATDARWREGFDLKVFATVNLTRALYLAMKQRRSGVIINIIGNCGERPDPEIIIATIANAGLMAFTKALGAASPNHGVRVLGVNPGPTATERLVALMQKKAEDRTGSAGNWKDLVAPLPFGRAATPAEVANLVVFAASDAASYISGTVLTVDGGVSARGHLF